jgi:feruloyl esterase
MRLSRLIALLAIAVAAEAATCSVDAISALRTPNMTVETANVVPAAGMNPEFCQIDGTVTTTGEGAPDGSARFDVRLPAKWNGKFLFYGVGGLAGSVPAQYDSEGALAQGYAIAVTDTGHQAGGTDARWALTASGEPDQAKIIDYYHRGAHSVTVAAKALVLKYYAADAIKRAYFGGCSNGGRMALQEAERYPDDFDGIISGAPFMSVRAVMMPLKVLKDMKPDGYIPPALLSKVDEAVYASCDAADGVKDGLIQNPGKCAFDPATLICKAGSTADCLTPGQADTLKRYMEPVRTRGGRLATPGLSITDLGGRGGMSAWTTGASAPDFSDPELWGGTAAPAGWLFGNHIVQYLVKRDPKFHSLTFGITRDGTLPDEALKLYDERTGAGSADDPNRLKPFLQKNKKLLMYHGFSDPALSPMKTMLFYEQLADLTKGGYDALQKNVRLFMVPGMQHCGGGPGPNVFSMLTALDTWVDQGVAPDRILATKYTNDRRTEPVVRRMPLCKFPEQAKYSGSGDVNDAANWSCSANPSLLETGPNGITAGLPAGRPR